LYAIKETESLIRLYLQEKQNGARSEAFFAIDPLLETEIVSLTFESAEPFTGGEGVYNLIAEKKIK